MSNVIPFKRPERRIAKVSPFTPTPQSSHEPLSQDEMVSLMRWRFPDSVIETDDGRTYLPTLELQEECEAFFRAFGFDYYDYWQEEDGVFCMWHALADSLIGHVLMCLRNPETFELVKVVRPPEWAHYIRAVAMQDHENVIRYRHIAEPNYKEARAEYAGKTGE